MRKLPSWRVSRQSCDHNHMTKYSILAVAGAVRLLPLHRWNRARPSPASPYQKINMPMPKPVSSQRRKPNICIMNFVIIATKLANLIKLYQLACLNMSARHIYPAILPASPYCCARWFRPCAFDWCQRHTSPLQQMDQ